MVEHMMGALYEDVEKFFGDLFAAYGRFVARHPVVFVIVPLLTSSLLGLGLLSLEYEQRIERLYTPMGSQAFKDQEYLDDYFHDKTRDAYYPHQLLYLPTYGEMVVTATDGRNVLRSEFIQDVTRVIDEVRAMTIDEHGRGHVYGDLCARREEQCIVDGEAVLQALANGANCIDSNASSIPDATGLDILLHRILGDISTENHCIQARALKLRFNLKHDTSLQRHLSLMWEKAFLRIMASLSIASERLTITYATSESLGIELAEHTGLDTKYFALTIIIMVLYTTLVSSGGNWVSSRIMLAQAGIVAALLAILASFGLLSLCGLKFVDLCGVMPFMVLGLGVDDMFILISGFRRTDIRLSLEERISETYRTSAISVTITSLTDLIAFCIGATSPFLSIRNFCVYAGVAVLFCYINQLTMFGACLVLNGRRVAASRHAVTCLPTASASELSSAGSSRLEVLCCAGQSPKKSEQEDSWCEKLSTKRLSKLLLQVPSKLIVLGLFIIYLAAAIIGASQIKIGLKLQSIVPEASYLSAYYENDSRYFQSSGPDIMFCVTSPKDYSDWDNRYTINQTLKRALQSEYVDDKSKISWLNAYESHLLRNASLAHLANMDYDHNRSKKLIYSKQYVEELVKFIDDHHIFQHDVEFNEERTVVIASRFYVTGLHMNDSTAEINMMRFMRDIAANKSLPMTAYSPQFVYYEHYEAILKNALLAVGVAIIGMLFIALAFIPHPVSIVCVTVTMITIVLGMFGFMHFWGLSLSAITTVQIILSVGFCVDFTVHISHAFMAATGMNRNERVSKALDKVGVPIIHGAISSILGIFMLAFASSYVFQSFFKTMLLVILLGLGHSCLLLPVVLSFIGPKHTNKPRIFIPVSNSSRSNVANPPTKSSGDGGGPSDQRKESDEMDALRGFHMADMIDTPIERHRLLGKVDGSRSQGDRWETRTDPGDLSPGSRGGGLPQGGLNPQQHPGDPTLIISPIPHNFHDHYLSHEPIMPITAAPSTSSHPPDFEKMETAREGSVDGGGSYEREKFVDCMDEWF